MGTLQAIAFTIDQIVELDGLQIGSPHNRGWLNQAKLGSDGINDLQKGKLCHLGAGNHGPGR
jgi:hypothetical protein